MPSTFDRRELLARGSAALLHLAVARPGTRASCNPQFRSPLPVLPVLQPVRRDSSDRYYEIAQRRASVEIIRGTRTQIWGYNGSFPGPTIEARRGRAAVVTHTNCLVVPTVAHLHGGVTRPQSDGFPTDTLAPGEARTHEYDNLGRPATLWYHDHSWPATGRNLYMGLAGFYLLQEDSELESQLPNGPLDVPLMLHDRAFTTDGQLDYDHDRHHGATGRVMLVNGAPWPFLEVANRKYRFRILNASNATAMRLALSTHHPFGTDCQRSRAAGGPVVLSTIALAMAERVESSFILGLSPWNPGGPREQAWGRPPPIRHAVRCRPHGARRQPRSRTSRRYRPARLVTGCSDSYLRVWGEAHPRRAAWCSVGHQWRAIRPAARRRESPTRRRRGLALRQPAVCRTDDVASGAHPSGAVPGAEPERACAFAAGGWLERYSRDRRRRGGGSRHSVARVQGRYLLHCHNLEHEDHSMMARIDVV